MLNVSDFKNSKWVFDRLLKRGVQHNERTQELNNPYRIGGVGELGKETFTKQVTGEFFGARRFSSILTCGVSMIVKTQHNVEGETQVHVVLGGERRHKFFLGELFNGCFAHSRCGSQSGTAQGEA